MNVGDEGSKPVQADGSIAGTAPSASKPSSPWTDHSWMLWLIVIAPVAAVATVATLYFLSAITGILRIILISQFIALALEPGVNWLAGRGWRRGVATGALMGGIAIVAVLVLLSILPTVISELAGLLADLPNALADLGERLGFDISASKIEEVLQNERADLAALAADLAATRLS